MKPRLRGERVAIAFLMGSALAICVGAVLLFVWLTQSFLCNQRWSASGLDTQYGIFSGCLIEVTPGRYVPEERIQEFAN